MIRTEADYQEAVKRLRAERARLAEHRTRFADQGFGPDEVEALMEPLECFHQQLADEVKAYERIKRGEFAAFQNLAGLGQALIGFRIHLGLTQRSLAEMLGVSEAQVSRDERNEYHGITLERAQRILEAMGVQLLSNVEFRQPVARTV